MTAALRDSIYGENTNETVKSERTPPRLSLPAEREGNLTKSQKKINTKLITINKDMKTRNQATGRQDAE